MHTCWSDGSSTIAEMAEEAKKRSYEYIAITDHSKGLKIAGGMDELTLRKQASEITRFNAPTANLGDEVTVLRSVERVIWLLCGIETFRFSGIHLVAFIITGLA